MLKSIIKPTVLGQGPTELTELTEEEVAEFQPVHHEGGVSAYLDIALMQARHLPLIEDPHAKNIGKLYWFSFLAST